MERLEKPEKWLRKFCSILITWSPLIQTVILTGGVLLSTVIAICLEHVSVYIPYISEAGAFKPEMGIFSAALVYGSYVGFLMFFCRYKMIPLMVNEDDKKTLQVNFWALVAGIMSMCGVGLVSAYPMTTDIYLHGAGSTAFYSCGILYMILQTYISFKLEKPYNNVLMSKIRLGTTIALIPTLIILGICGPVGYFGWQRIYPERPWGFSKKTPEDWMFGTLLAGAIVEWVLAAFVQAFYLTFIPDFRKFQLLTSIRELTTNDTDKNCTSHSNKTFENA